MFQRSATVRAVCSACAPNEHAVVPERDRAGFSEDFGATIALECLGSQQEI